MIPQGPLVTVLPKTIETLRESAPEYLLWKDGQKTKAAMRQLSVAFEDNIATGMNWAGIAALKSDPSATDALEYCMKNPVLVGNTPVHILGITHSSDHSAEHVKLAMEQLNPALVALESCVDRTQARVAIQLPLVERFEGDWETLTDLSEFGGQGPSITDLAQHGLLDGRIDVAQFMVASGSVSGCPELTALYLAKKRQIAVESIDILESVKIVQNASIDACGYTSKRGDLSEGVLRQVFEEEGILSEYFRIMYGGDKSSNVQPSFLYRLVESRKRSPPFADLLLRELHRVYRPKQYWGRVFLRDLYMSLRVRRVVSQLSSPEKPVLVIVGAAHAFGVGDMLKSAVDMTVHATVGLSALMENAETLCDAWRNLLGMESFATALPRHIGSAESAAALIAITILSASKVSLWVGQEWQVVELPPAKEGQAPGDRLSQLTNFQVGAGVGKVDLVQELVDGRVDPYSVARIEAQTAAEFKE